MANIKISELTALTPPDAADLVPVTDSSASQTKRTTVGEIVGIINGDVDVATDGTATISELPVSKLQDGSARQLLQTDAAGTGVEWTSDVDVPGTLDVTGAATLDSTLGVTGQSTLASAAVSDLTSGRVVLAGTSGELEDSAGLTFNGTQLDVDGNVVITGDLTVEGASTILETETVKVEDKNIELGVVASPTDVTADGGGITLKGTTDKTINWVDATDAWTSSERFSVPLGSDGAPSLTFTGDTNTGIYSPGADQLALSTNGTGRLFVDANGRIGIGTASVNLGGWGNAVTLQGVSNAAYEVTDGSVRTSLVSAAGSFGIVGTNTNHPFLIRTNNTERLHITSTGLVGIGTSSPGATLHVEGLGNTVNQRIFTSDNVQNATASLTFGTTPGARSKAAVQMVNSNTGNAYGDLSLLTNDGTGLQNRLYITSAGNVGIGTTSPSVNLEVVGQASAGAYIASSGAGSSGYSFSASGSGASVANMFCPSGFTLAFGTNSVERARIDSSGRLLVGTSSSADLNASVQSIGTTAYRFYGFRYGADNGILTLGSANGTQASPSVLASPNLNLGILQFRSYDGVAYRDGAWISAVAESQWSSGNCPTRLVFSTTAASASAPTERARIDSSGRLLVGTSSAGASRNIYGGMELEAPQAGNNAWAHLTQYGNSYTNRGARLYLNFTLGTSAGSATAVTTEDELGAIHFRGANGTTFQSAAEIRGETDTGTISGTSMPGRLVFSTTADGASSPTERMRIDNAGNILIAGEVSPTGKISVGQSGAASAIIFGRHSNATSAVGVQIQYSTAFNNTANPAFYFSDGTLRAEIRSNGGLANYQANDVNLSDRNAKKDISPAAGTWNCIKEWEIVNYRYKDQPDDADLNLGVIAQQVAESCPEVITVFEEAKDDQPEKLGVKEQQMMWMAIKALQEAQTRIETLEAEVAALKAS